MKSASNRKSVVSSAVPNLKNLSTVDKLVLTGVTIWCITMGYWLYTDINTTDDVELYRDNIRIESENIA